MTTRIVPLATAELQLPNTGTPPPPPDGTMPPEGASQFSDATDPVQFMRQLLRDDFPRSQKAYQFLDTWSAGGGTALLGPTVPPLELVAALASISQQGPLFHELLLSSDGRSGLVIHAFGNALQTLIDAPALAFLRSAALYALAAVDPKRALPQLLAAVDGLGEDPVAARLALEALGTMETGAESVPTLLRSIASPSIPPEIEIAGLKALTQNTALNYKNVIPHVWAMASGPSPEVRRAAAETLGTFSAWLNPDDLQYRFRDPETSEERDALREALKRLHIEIQNTLTDGESDWTQGTAMRVLSALGTPAIPIWTALIQDRRVSFIFPKEPIILTDSVLAVIASQLETDEATTQIRAYDMLSHVGARGAFAALPYIDTTASGLIRQMMKKTAPELAPLLVSALDPSSADMRAAVSSEPLPEWRFDPKTPDRAAAALLQLGERAWPALVAHQDQLLALQYRLRLPAGQEPPEHLTQSLARVETIMRTIANQVVTREVDVVRRTGQLTSATDLLLMRTYAMSTLIRLLTEPDAGAARNAAGFLLEMGPEAFAAVAELRDHPDAVVRDRAHAFMANASAEVIRAHASNTAEASERRKLWREFELKDALLRGK